MDDNKFLEIIRDKRNTRKDEKDGFDRENRQLSSNDKVQRAILLAAERIIDSVEDNAVELPPMASPKDIQVAVDELRRLSKITEGKEIDFSELAEKMDNLSKMVESLPGLMPKTEIPEFPKIPEFPEMPSTMKISNLNELTKEFKKAIETSTKETGKAVQKIDVKPVVNVEVDTKPFTDAVDTVGSKLDTLIEMLPVMLQPSERMMDMLWEMNENLLHIANRPIPVGSGGGLGTGTSGGGSTPTSTYDSGVYDTATYS